MNYINYVPIGILLIGVIMLASIIIPLLFLVPIYKRWLRNTYCKGCKKGFENSQYKNRLITFKVLLGLSCFIITAAFLYILDKLVCNV